MGAVSSCPAPTPWAEMQQHREEVCRAAEAEPPAAGADEEAVFELRFELEYWRSEVQLRSVRNTEAAAAFEAAIERHARWQHLYEEKSEQDQALLEGANKIYQQIKAEGPLDASARWSPTEPDDSGDVLLETRSVGSQDDASVGGPRATDRTEWIEVSDLPPPPGAPPPTPAASRLENDDEVVKASGVPWATCRQGWPGDGLRETVGEAALAARKHGVWPADGGGSTAIKGSLYQPMSGGGEGKRGTAVQRMEPWETAGAVALALRKHGVFPADDDESTARALLDKLMSGGERDAQDAAVPRMESIPERYYSSRNAGAALQARLFVPNTLPMAVPHGPLEAMRAKWPLADGQRCLTLTPADDRCALAVDQWRVGAWLGRPALCRLAANFCTRLATAGGRCPVQRGPPVGCGGAKPHTASAFALGGPLQGGGGSTDSAEAAGHVLYCWLLARLHFELDSQPGVASHAALCPYTQLVMLHSGARISPAKSDLWLECMLDAIADVLPASTESDDAAMAHASLHQLFHLLARGVVNDL
ncbi:hypothetical protein DIPPA_18606 [Diplonema papillatum]|nr:hypothetical protein DIPPA_18606 [Diplonema papillatum]|eukprot:gene11525-17746_t